MIGLANIKLFDISLSNIKTVITSNWLFSFFFNFIMNRDDQDLREKSHQSSTSLQSTLLHLLPFGFERLLTWTVRQSRNPVEFIRRLIWRRVLQLRVDLATLLEWILTTDDTPPLIGSRTPREQSDGVRVIRKVSGSEQRYSITAPLGIKAESPLCCVMSL